MNSHPRESGEDRFMAPHFDHPRSTNHDPPATGHWPPAPVSRRRVRGSALREFCFCLLAVALVGGLLWLVRFRQKIRSIYGVGTPPLQAGGAAEQPPK
ncbi:MAG: hypothetical protein HZA54_04295 [Planctomycetes bacterium]|nr:hypothetical protein [Planctomycetota bacterium]